MTTSFPCGTLFVSKTGRDPDDLRVGRHDNKPVACANLQSAPEAGVHVDRCILTGTEAKIFE